MTGVQYDPLVWETDPIQKPGGQLRLGEGKAGSPLVFHLEFKVSPLPQQQGDFFTQALPGPVFIQDALEHMNPPRVQLSI